MKPLMVVLVLSLIGQSAFGACDWSQIRKDRDGNYTYSPELHLCVGELVRDNKLKDEEIVHLKRAVELSDLALTKSQAQNEAWLNSSIKVQDQLLKYQNASEMDGWLKFSLGVAVTALAVFGAGQLNR